MYQQKKFNPEIINEIKRIEEIEKHVDRDKIVYKSTSRIYDFRGFKTIRTYGNDIRNNVTSLKAANLEQANLMAHLYDFTKNTNPQNSEQKKLKSDVLNSVGALAKGREVMFNAFRSGIFHRLQDKNGENVPHLEIVELVLVHCNFVNNDYQQDSRILYTFVPNKTFGSLLEISPTNQVFLKTFNSAFQEVKIWFTDQTSKPLELEDKINITLIIK